MILHVLKHPSAREIAICHEVSDEAPVPPGWEAMSTEEFNRWRDEEILSGWAPPQEPPPVPGMITNAQCRVILIRQGINPDDVLSYIISAPMPSERLRQEVKARWEYANHIYRNDPETLQIAKILKFTDEQLDDLFRAAALVK